MRASGNALADGDGLPASQLGSGESALPQADEPRPVRPSALLCSKCHKPIRKGQGMLIRMFARHAGVIDGQQATDPWLTVITHLREGCDRTLTPEVIREARKAALAPRTKREET